MRVDYEEFKEKLPELMGKVQFGMDILHTRNSAYYTYNPARALLILFISKITYRKFQSRVVIYAPSYGNYLVGNRQKTHNSITRRQRKEMQYPRQAIKEKS